MARYSALKGLYEVEKSIGSGGFAKVKLCTHLLTREKVAIKIMEKLRLGDDLRRVKIEMEALKNLPHQNICKLLQVIETGTHYYLVLEYCSGGELFEHIVEQNRLEEKESRIFFRQIVSAVAYLHDKGYAHRDLKPENVLIDKDNNLKLIDFGLCAKPQPGLDAFLYTSCGSPTYAAPEVILGQKYLGAEVDIWSLGILLYALLCGLLPFDDENIDSLYRKILSGRYEEPSWLSEESKDLIHTMLQVDPKKRITIKQLLCHPWMLKGFKAPVVKDSCHKTLEKDPTCINVMAQHYGVSSETMWSHLSAWKYDYDTATYMLLLSKKHRNLPVKLVRHPLRMRMGAGVNTMECSPYAKGFSFNSTFYKLNSPCSTPVENDLHTTYLIFNGKEATPDKGICLDVPNSQSASLGSETVHWNNDNQENDTPHMRQTHGVRKPHKRLWSPGPDEKRSPVPVKVKPLKANEHQATYVLVPRGSSKANEAGVEESGVNAEATAAATNSSAPGKRQAATASSRVGDAVQPLQPSACGDGTPARGFVTSAATPRCTKMLGSLERSLHRMRHMLTPRRRPVAASGEAPRPVLLSAKNVCNVSTTSNDNADAVLEELQKTLQKMGITCIQKGYTLRGKLHAAKESGPSSGVPCRLSFELEVCLVASPDSEATPLVGIRRKRLKGDAWSYKRVVEEVLAMARA